ncbi:MAG: CCA tRNA nucleotidyltransferase [Deltaproteobacteria bacterium]|nr:CCA tRNA nucleotidyltransferase [Deltaproteobacteria bacterium]
MPEKPSAPPVTPPSAPEKPSAARTKSSSKLTNAATEVVRRLTDAGFEAFFAGGSVRDMLMGRTPDDIDIATSARPDQVMEIFRKTVAVGAAFGVVVVLHRRFEFQVATFRSDGAYLDGRHPDSVHFSTAREDVERRDFTINGMLYDPTTDRIMDWVGGRDDLAARVVRAIGDPAARIKEDRLRMLRAVRFAARFDFRIEPAAWRAVCEASDQILQVSWERIRDELTKMFVGRRPHVALRLLESSGLLAQVLPEVATLRDVAQSAKHHPEGDVLRHVEIMLEEMDRIAEERGERPPVELAMAVLFHDLGKATCSKFEDGRITTKGHEREGAKMARTITERLRMSKAQTKTIAALAADHMKPMFAPHMRPATLKRLMREDHFPLLLDLFFLDSVGKRGNLDGWRWLKDRYESTPETELHPPRLLTGKDLIDMGYEPGPKFQEVLDRIEEAQLDGNVSNADDARRLVRRILGRPKPR